MPRPPSRRRFLRTLSALAAASALPAGWRDAQAAAQTWVATWGIAQAGPPPAATTLTFSNQTLRLIAHASIGGSRVRVRISNEMGSTPLRIGAARIALRASGAGIVAGSDRALSFGGATGATIAAGAALLSDAATLMVPAQADLAVSVYLPASVQATTIHDLGLQTHYVSSAGNYAAAATLPVARSLASCPFLTEVDVAGNGGAVVALGDSLTDGIHSTANANRRWPDWLARRLLTERAAGSLPVGVVNRGISGNSLLKDYPDALLAGRSALARFDRDVAATSGLRWLVVLIGINDIVYSPASNPVPVANLTAGYQQLINRAHAYGAVAIGATMPPFEGQAYYTAAREAVRQRANAWTRTSGAWNAVLDFDAVLRDPSRPTRLLPAYDGGDHLHPNDAGYQAMARAVPLGWFV